MSNKIIVLALGGNAISKTSRSFDSQYDTIRSIIKKISDLVKMGNKIVITHGNGPQVGDAILRNFYAKNYVPFLPLYACVAETQGMLGAMIQAALIENLKRDFRVASIITKVSVNPKDYAFRNPTKQIGPILSKEKILEQKRIEPTACYKEIFPEKYRMVVPSPEPVSILELDAIKNLLKDNYTVIACGGGGIPVTEGRKINFVNAVIDKDLASEILATGINASLFVSLTDVRGAYMNFRTKNKKMLKKIHVEKMRELLEKKNFEEGTMEPKIRAAVRFVGNNNGNAVIASLENLKKAVNLKSGTIIYKD